MPRRSPVTVRTGTWAVILAGGDGVRLRGLTRGITGDDRPKQFCALVGPDTLLGDTRRRTARAVPGRRTLIVVTKSHERYYRPLLTGVPESSVVVQPENRGTGAAILYALLQIAATAPQDTVAFFPSDHYVSDDEAFMAHVEQAFETTRQRPDLVTLLGITPERVEPGYGWIQAGEPVAGVQPAGLRWVRRFSEKPALSERIRFPGQGWLWNSFVMVGQVSTFLHVLNLAVPSLCEAFNVIRPTLGSTDETAAVERLYRGLASVDFSREVLSARPDRLAVLPVQDVHWNDLGDPDRLLASWRHVLQEAIPETLPVRMSA